MAELPRLRRYARALTGSLHLGDALVSRALEQTVPRLETMPGNSLPLRLFAGLSRVWSASGAPQTETDHGASSRQEELDHRIRNIRGLARQVYLLFILEDFARQDIAVMLDIPIQKVDDLIAQTHASFARSIASDILIISDDTSMSSDLEAILRNLGHRVMAMPRSPCNAAFAPPERDYRIVFTDLRGCDDITRAQLICELRAAGCSMIVLPDANGGDGESAGAASPHFTIGIPLVSTEVQLVTLRALIAP